MPIDWTVLDLSALIPAGAKAAIIQVGVFTESTSSGARAEVRIRTDEVQRDALEVSNKGSSQTDFNQGVGPLTSGRTLQYNLAVTGVISVTVWITVVGYIV